jgi:transcriptional regulator with XRE-family HTH domain
MGRSFDARGRWSPLATTSTFTWASVCAAAAACGVRFQQIQKYECGANRISAARLWQLSEALEVPVGYFYDGLSDEERAQANQSEPGGEMFARKETLDLIRAYYQLGERPRRRLLDLAKSLNGDNGAA